MEFSMSRELGFVLAGFLAGAGVLSIIWGTVLGIRGSGRARVRREQHDALQSLGGCAAALEKAGDAVERGDADARAALVKPVDDLKQLLHTSMPRLDVYHVKYFEGVAARYAACINRRIEAPAAPPAFAIQPPVLPDASAVKQFAPPAVAAAIAAPVPSQPAMPEPSPIFEAPQQPSAPAAFEAAPVAIEPAVPYQTAPVAPAEPQIKIVDESISQFERELESAVTQQIDRASLPTPETRRMPPAGPPPLSLRPQTDAAPASQQDDLLGTVDFSPEPVLDLPEIQEQDLSSISDGTATVRMNIPRPAAPASAPMPSINLEDILNRPLPEIGRPAQAMAAKPEQPVAAQPKKAEGSIISGDDVADTLDAMFGFGGKQP